MEKRFFDQHGNYEVHVSHDDGNLVFEERYDDSCVAEAAKVLSDEVPSKEFRHFAKIPLSVLNRSVREGWLHDPKAWEKWYKDSDNRDFRVHAGRDTNFHAGNMLIIGGE